MMFRGEGVFSDRVAEARAAYGDVPLVAELLAFIDAPSHRGLIRAQAIVESDNDAA
jgi:UDP-N-acetylglucosamine acyltransferase